jgi:hypothetical protein
MFEMMKIICDQLYMDELVYKLHWVLSDAIVFIMENNCIALDFLQNKDKHFLCLKHMLQLSLQCAQFIKDYSAHRLGVFVILMQQGIHICTWLI